MKNSNSPLFTVNEKAVLKAAIMSVIGAVLTGLVNLGNQIVQTQNFTITWQQLAIIGVGGIVSGASYLIVKLATNAQDQLLKKDIK